MKICLFGAAGSGTTTQGTDLASKLNIPYFDSDNYFWEETDIPFTKRRDPTARNSMLYADTKNLSSYIIGGGSLPKWDESWLAAFDLVVFLYIPHKIRMDRLRNRELDRYGDVIFNHQERNRQYNEFIQWCSGYDDDTASGRTLSVHKQWIEQFNCPVLQILQDLDVQVITQMILKLIKQLC